MTLLIVWKERGAERIWVVSDSRLSNPGEVGEVRLTDRAAKILEAPILLHRSPIGEPQSTLLRKTVLGFAYAGSSLVALQAYAAVLPLWSRLEAMEKETLPSIRDCAVHLGKFVEGYFRDVGAGCQCVLFGHDDPSGFLDAWLVETRVERNGAGCQIRQLQLSAPPAIEFFGNGRQDALATLAAWQNRRTSSYWGREPLHMIRESLRDDRLGGVGGAVQLGIATRTGFELYFDVQGSIVLNRVVQSPLQMTYRGFDVNDVMRVGNAFVAMRGIGEQPHNHGDA